MESPPTAADFWDAAGAQPCCQAPDCPDPGGPWHAHHGVYRAVIEGRTLWRVRVELSRWDPRNAVRLTLACHELHHKAMPRLPIWALPVGVLVFAGELLGPELAVDYLKRYYAGPDPRLARLLAGTLRLPRSEPPCLPF